MKIKMLQDTKVSLDGVHNTLWEAGRVEDAPEDLAQSLIKGKLAESVKEPNPKPKPKEKAADSKMETPEDPGKS